jgi:hypothetical protein
LEDDTSQPTASCPTASASPSTWIYVCSLLAVIEKSLPVVYNFKLQPTPCFHWREPPVVSKGLSGSSKTT